MQKKTTVYKLTNRDMTTYVGFRWEIGKQATASGKGDLCGRGWLHCYSDPLLAVLLTNHADMENPRLFRAEAGGKSKHDRGLQSGYTRMALIEEIPVPDVTTEQRVRFAILCSLKVYHDPAYVSWAEGWLSGKDRSDDAAWIAATTAGGGWIVGAVSAAWAARAAARVPAASWAAETAETAACAALRAVVDAASVADLDLVAIAREACPGRSGSM